MYSISFCVTTIILGICVLIVNTSDLNAVETYCEGTGWVPYRDEKCLKLIKDFKTRDQAREVCAQEWIQSDSFTPQLVSIKSVEEQMFLSEFLFDTEAIEGNVWIGARRENDQKFVWDDGSEVEFANWDQGSPTEESKRGCAVIQSDYSRKFANSSSILPNKLLSIKGKWRDVACGQGNYAICQKLPKWSFGKLQQTLLDTRKHLVDSNVAVSTELGYIKRQLGNTQTELSVTKTELNNLKQTLIPIGFIYTQLPIDKAPNEIWPWMTWIDVSSAYEGVFFRVTGGEAAPFGQVQDDNAPRVTKVNVNTDAIEYYRDADLSKNFWTRNLLVGNTNPPINSGHRYFFMKFFTSDGEVRPRNMAIRIWKRTS